MHSEFPLGKIDRKYKLIKVDFYNKLIYRYFTRVRTTACLFQSKSKNSFSRVESRSIVSILVRVDASGIYMLFISYIFHQTQ